MYEEKRCVGGIFFSRIAYVQEKHGKDGVNRLLEQMKRNGYRGPMSEKEIKVAKMYPIEYNILFLKTYRDMFGERNFKRMARASPKKRGFVGMFLKWAGTPEMLINKAGDYWKKMYNFGELKGETTGENSAIIKGSDVSVDPIFCDFLTDYFIGVIENTNVKNIECSHVKCIYGGDDECKWIITWGEKKQSKEIKWDDSLETGSGEIDRQHKYFIKVLAELDRSIRKNSKISIKRYLNFMDRYAHWHFSSEEKHMKKYAYPHYEEHKKQHELFYRYTEEIKKKAEDGDINEDFIYSVNKYLVDWLINHIKGTDAKFAEFLRYNNLEMEEEDMDENMRKEVMDMT